MFKLRLAAGADKLWRNTWFKRGALLGTGLGLKWLMDGPFDYILYPFVMWYTGTYFDSWLLGAIIMTAASIPLNWLQIRLYDAAKVDFFSIEALKSFEADGIAAPASRWNKLQVWIKSTMKRSKLFAFFFLSWNDPFYVVVYFRKPNSTFNGLTKRDWLIFIAATITANGYWILLILLGFETIETASEVGIF